MTGITKDEIVPVLFLTLVVCIAVIALTITDAITKDLIEEQKDKEIQENLEVLFPEMDEFEEDDDEEFYIVYVGSGANRTIIGFAFTVEGEGYGGTIEMLVGIEAYSYLATERLGGQEYSYTVSAGFEPDVPEWNSTFFPVNGTTVYNITENNATYTISVERTPLNETDIDMVTLRGLKVVIHAETPGLGAKITEDDFQDQFEGIALGDLALTADGGEVDAISGATISSEAVTESVYDTVKSKVKKINSWLEEVEA